MKRKKKSSVWGVLGLILIISVAMVLPQVIFIIQDYREMTTIDVMSRDTYEVLATDTAYPRDINTRMSRLAGVGYGNITISQIANSIDVNELNEMLDGVKKQGYMTNLAELFPTTFGYITETMNATALDVCDCYIVYGDEYHSGVILMFWYMEFDFPELNSRMELLVDSETNTIYYVRLRENDINTSQSNGSLVSGTDFYYDSKTVNAELMYMEPEIKAVAEMQPSQVSDYYSSYYGIYMPDSELLSLASSTFWGEHTSISENSYTLAFALPYSAGGERSLFFRFHAEVGEETGTDISIGIPIIRQMIQS